MAVEKILCVIPARGGSKRFPGKNVAPLMGKPLIAWTIEAALEAKEAGILAKVMVSTEGKEIARVSRECGAEIIDRPPELASDEARLPDVGLHALEYMEKRGERFGILCMLEPTCPLRTAEDIRAAVMEFTERKADYLLSVTESKMLLRGLVPAGKSGFLKPVFGKKRLVRDQENPPLYIPNGAIILAKAEQFKKDRDYYGGKRRKLAGYEMPPERSVDIDEPWQLKLAEFFLKAVSRA